MSTSFNSTIHDAKSVDAIRAQKVAEKLIQQSLERSSKKKKGSGFITEARSLLRDVFAKRKRTVTERKVGNSTVTETKVEISDEMVGSIRHFFRSSNQDRWRCKLRGGVVLSSTAGGVISLAQPMDPSSGGAQDWSSYAAIFDLFRVVGVKASLVTRPGSALAGTATDYFGGFYYVAADATSAPTPAIATLLDCENVELVGNYPSKHTYKFDLPRLDVLDFVPTSAPSGAVGSIMVYGENWAPSSSLIMEAMFEYDIEFMMVGV